MEELLVLVTLILVGFLVLPVVAIVRTAVHGPPRAHHTRRAT